MHELCSVGQIICALQACLKKKDLSYAKHIHECIRRIGLETHEDVGNHMVPAYVECGSLHDAQEVFDRLVRRNVFSWTYLMLGYIESGQPHSALNAYTKMQADNVHPNRHTFVVLLKACACLKDVQQGQAYHGEVLQKGMELDFFIGSTLIDMYAKCGSLWEAQELFDRLAVKDVVLWNVLLGGYAEHGEDHKALKSFTCMQFEKIPPNMVTFSCMLKASGNLGAIRKGQEFFEEIVGKGFERDPFVASSVIDMYVKSGFLMDAHNVLNSLPVRSIVVWNALIAGYAEYGYGEEVIRCIEQMQLEGDLQDVVTLLCVLKSCGILGALERGHETHSQITSRGFETHAFVGSSLVDMYAKCDSLSEAWEVFENLLVRNAVSWNVMISGYGEHAHIDEAFECFQEMQREGIISTPATFVCLLKACATMGIVSEGQELNAEILRRGLEKDTTVGNALVDMYGKCGALSEAQKVFSMIPNCTTVAWNTLISCYAEHGYWHEAADCFERMQREHIGQDGVTFASVLKAYGELATADKGCEIHSEILKRGYDKDCLVGSMLVVLYAKCGFSREAQVVFDKIAIQNSLSWTALISGYVENGLEEDSWKGFKQMQSQSVFPTAVTYICVLKACGYVMDVDRGQELHMEIVKKGFEEQPSVRIALLGMYAKCAMLVDAQDCLINENVVSWNLLVLGYAEHGLNKAALHYYKEMQLKHVVEDAVTFVSVLKACSALEALEDGRHVHGALTLKGFESDQSIGSTLVDMYVSCGCLAEAREVLKDLPGQNVVPWNALITGLMECGLSLEVQSCYEQMQVRGISPNVVTYLCLLKAWGTEWGALKKGLDLHTNVVYKGLDVDRHVSSTLVDMYIKCGSLAEAHGVFNKLEVHSNISWNAMIKGYGMNNQGNTALKFYEKMCAQGLKPDSITFTCLLTACNRTNMLVQGQELFEVMREKHGIVPTIDHLTCMVDLLARSGQLNEAAKYLEIIPCSPSKEMWTALLNACKTFQEGGGGYRCFERLLDKGYTPLIAP